MRVGFLDGIWQFCELVTLFLGMVSERVKTSRHPKTLGWTGDLTGHGVLFLGGVEEGKRC